MADLLVVDDDQDIAEALEGVLLSMGHSVRVARNGEDGLRLLGESYPDLVLLDVEMPVLTGPEMSHRMLILDVGRERIPIILLSGAMDLHLIAARVGTPYFLGKPYRLDRFCALLEQALVERHPPHPSR